MTAIMLFKFVKVRMLAATHLTVPGLVVKDHTLQDGWKDLMRFRVCFSSVVPAKRLFTPFAFMFASVYCQQAPRQIKYHN